MFSNKSKLLKPLILLVIPFILNACNSGGNNQALPKSITNSTDSIKSSLTNTTSSFFKIYTTGGSWMGDLDGISGADKKCQTDQQCPAGATCKALIVDSNHRNFAKNISWVLKPNTYYSYVASNGESLTVVTTESATFPADFIWPSTKMWTGLDHNWQIQDTCDGWTKGSYSKADSGTEKGNINLSGGKTNCFRCTRTNIFEDCQCFGKDFDGCSKRHLMCIEQASTVEECEKPAAPKINWHTCNKSMVDIHSADLTNADLTGINFTGANLTSTSLTQANLTGANLTSAVLAGADLSSATVSNVIWKNVVLKEANLSNINLSGADLRNNDLSGANLTNTDLTKVNLSKANLSRANLIGAKLNGANLSEADLSYAIWTDGKICDVGLGRCHHGIITVEPSSRGFNLKGGTSKNVTFKISNSQLVNYADAVITGTDNNLSATIVNNDCESGILAIEQTTCKIMIQLTAGDNKNVLKYSVNLNVTVINNSNGEQSSFKATPGLSVTTCPKNSSCHL